MTERLFPKRKLGLIGVAGLFLAGSAPFLWAAEALVVDSNPISIETRGIQVRDTEYRLAGGRDIPFREPIQEVGQNNDPDAGEVHYQMQILREEVQALRGIVEELRYALSQFKSTQDDRYLELDGRFQSLQMSGAKNVDQTINNKAVTDITATTDIAASSESEKSRYEAAIGLIRNRQYDLAINRLLSLINDYPTGTLAANAYYWLGEVYAAKPSPDYENARKSLAQVITFFPENRKVPDAAFKLGKVYHLMGDCNRATELLNQVINEHKGRSVAKLAEVYLREKVGSCQ